MAVANITVAFVNPPKAGQKKGSVKAEDGTYYGVWPDKLHQYVKGGHYTVEYDEQTGSDGRIWKTISRIVSNGSGQAPARATDKGGAPSFTRSEEMFVMGIIGRALQGTGGLPDEDTLTAYVVAARAAWQRGMTSPLGQPATPLQHQELNDEIPF